MIGLREEMVKLELKAMVSNPNENRSYRRYLKVNGVSATIDKDAKSRSKV